jgi:hypothetical protein
MCKSVFTIPKWATDGQYTIQWAWMGGSSYYGDKNRGQTTYQNCMDFTVTGGEAPVSKPATVCPLFKGGDPFNPAGDKCLTFVTNGNSEPTMKSCFPDGCYGKHVSVAPQAAANCRSSSTVDYSNTATAVKAAVPVKVPYTIAPVAPKNNAPSSVTPSPCILNPEYQKYLNQKKY